MKKIESFAEWPSNLVVRGEPDKSFIGLRWSGLLLQLSFTRQPRIRLFRGLQNSFAEFVCRIRFASSQQQQRQMQRPATAFVSASSVSSLLTTTETVITELSKDNAPAFRPGESERSCSMPAIKAIGDPSQSTFLSLEEAGLIEMTNLDMHEKFLARLTVSSLNLLKEISEQEGIPIEELNAGMLCDWFVRDKAKREKNVEAATLNSLVVMNCKNLGIIMSLQPLLSTSQS